MSIKLHLTAGAACLGLLMSGAALAQDHAYTEGGLVNVSYIRTVYGKFDEYMKYVDTTWKAEQEAAKKAGYITGYKVITIEARTENDPDIALVIYYKNWAALDDGTAKADAVLKQVEGSISASNKGAVDRNNIRRILGSWTGQELLLK
jgi:ABC-type branched-subunit amino acid transport system substrate-binding protein